MKHAMPRRGALALALALFLLVHAGAQASEPDRRVDTLKYGIESQVVELVAALKQEKNPDYDAILLELLSRSQSQKIREAALDFFGFMGDGAAVGPAAAIIKNRDFSPDSTVAAAFAYLIAVKSDAAAGEARRIVEDEEKKYFLAAVKMLGAAGGPEGAAVLAKAYERDSSPSIRQEILLAFGRMKAADSYELLAKVAGNLDSGKVERMYACASLGELGDVRAIPVLVGAANSDDPNVRAYAIGALAKFRVAEAEEAVIQALRDSHVVPRLAAAKAAGEGRLAAALPFLEYKASYDPEKTVREAAIDALGAIGGDRAMAFLVALLEDPKGTAAYRAKAFGVLVSATGPYRDKAKAAFAAAQAEKDRAFFMTLARTAMAIDAPGASEYAGLLLADKDYAVRLGAILWAERNVAREHLPALERLSAEDPVESVKKRALLALERIKSR